MQFPARLLSMNSRFHGKMAIEAGMEFAWGSPSLRHPHLHHLPRVIIDSWQLWGCEWMIQAAVPGSWHTVVNFQIVQWYCTTVPPFPLSEIVQSPELRDFEWWVSQNVYYPMPRNGRNPEPLANTRATGAPVELCIVLTKPKLNGDDSKKNSGPLKKTCDFRRLQTPQTFLQV